MKLTKKLWPTLLDKINPIWQNWINRKFFIPLGLGADLGFSRGWGGGGGEHFQRDFIFFLGRPNWYFPSSTRAKKKTLFDKSFCAAGKVLKNNRLFLHFLENFDQKIDSPSNLVHIGAKCALRKKLASVDFLKSTLGRQGDESLTGKGASPLSCPFP